MDSDGGEKSMCTGPREKIATIRCQDRFSLLPEAVLVYILSFLPTIEAVRASLVSKRWRNLWKSIHSLEFNIDKIRCMLTRRQGAREPYLRSKKRKMQREEELERMMNNKVIGFLSWTLSLYERNDVQKFCLQYTICDAQAINVLKHIIGVCIPNIVSRKVQYINICFTFGQTILYKSFCFWMPPCLSMSESLQVLKLNLGNSQLWFPDAMSFARLKTLHLISVVFCDENSIQKLFANSHFLENLTIEKCMRHKDFKVLHISSRSLRDLVVEIGNGCTFYETLGNCEFKIFTPSLKFFKYEGYAAPHFSFGEFSSLAVASIRCCSHWILVNSNHVKIGAEYARQILEGIYMVEVLNMCGLCIKALLPASPHPDPSQCLSTPFRQLRKLELNMDLIGKNLQPIICLINTNPCLRTLIMNLGVPEKDYSEDSYYYYECDCGLRNHSPQPEPKSDDEENKEKYLRVLNLSMQSRLQNLRKVVMRNIVGELEIEFLKYLLKTQIFLESLIGTLSYKCRKSQVTIGEELLGFPRTTSCLAILLSYE